MNKTLKEVKEAYESGITPLFEFLTDLVGLARFYPIAEIVANLDKCIEDRLREFVKECSTARSDSEFMTWNMKPCYGVAEVRKFMDYFQNIANEN